MWSFKLGLCCDLLLFFSSFSLSFLLKYWYSDLCQSLTSFLTQILSLYVLSPHYNINKSSCTSIFHYSTKHVCWFLPWIDRINTLICLGFFFGWKNVQLRLNVLFTHYNCSGCPSDCLDTACFHVKCVFQHPDWGKISPHNP